MSVSSIANKDFKRVPIVTRIPFTSIYGYIYCTTCLINNKKYIGQHKWDKPYLDTNYYGSGTIFLKALNKYGKENFVVEIWNWAESRDSLDDLEKFYININNAVEDPNFYNIDCGGKSMKEDFSQTEDVRLRISNTLKGRPSPMKGRKQTEKFMEYLKNMPRVMTEETARKIGDAQMGEKNHRYGKRGLENYNSIPVVQLTLSGEYVNSYESMCLAGDSVGIHEVGIGHCLSGKWTQTGGYRWLRLDEYNSETPEYWISKYSSIPKNAHFKPVVRLSLDGELEKEYESVKSTELDGFDGDYVSQCCKGTKLKYRNHLWMYLKDYKERGNNILCQA